MAMTIEQFRQQVVHGGLMSDAELSAVLGRIPPDKRPGNVESLASELVRAGKLTKYQAAAIYQGKTKGLVLGDYVVLDKLGQGGMGMVLKAQHRRMKRLVAIKVLTSANRAPTAVKRFYREVEMAARLSHPNIVAAYDSGEHEGILYLVMEYVEGKDLGALIKQRGAMAVKGAINCVLQTARGLQYAHSRNVIHRDIKPGNLLIDNDGNVKILDMGLARYVDPDQGAQIDAERLTQTGQVMGTGEYMAPEQATDPRNADHRADIYSLGCTLYRLLTGRPPYMADTLVTMLLAHRDWPTPSLCDAVPNLSPSVDAIFQKMVAKRPEDRYQSMAEVAADLEAFLAGRPPSIAVAPGPSAATPQKAAPAPQAVASARPVEAPASSRSVSSDHVAVATPPGSVQRPFDAVAVATAHQRARRRWRTAVASLSTLLMMIVGVLIWELAYLR